MTSSDEQHTDEPSKHHTKCYTLFFIRHGEALHNVLEKQAKQEALEEAIAQGLDAQDEIVKLRQEKARMAVLNNDSLQDCPLTPLGVEEALGAKEKIHQLTSPSEENGVSKRPMLPYPTQVLVSPLQRALQTADTIFPQHQSIHVREELRERQTLKACDTRQDSRILSKRPEFARFSMNQLRLASLSKFSFPDASYFDDLLESDEEKGNNDRKGRSTEGSGLHASMASMVGDLHISDQSDDEKEKTIQEEIDDDQVELELQDLAHDEVEEKHVLRQRTKKLFGLIGESQHRFIAVVAHKGYLRELERGPLGQPDAKEFKNCEVRVYKVSLLPAPTRSSGIPRMRIQGEKCGTIGVKRDFGVVDICAIFTAENFIIKLIDIVF